LITFAQDYDCLLFDASLNAPDWTPLPGAAQILIIEANATHASVLQGYDCLLFDASLNAPDWTPLPGAAQIFIIEVNATHASALQGYALLKTLSHLGSRVGAGLLGDAAACDQLLAACKQFLEPAFAQAVYSVAHEDDAFAALAVRMANEETRLMARYKTESTGTWP